MKIKLLRIGAVIFLGIFLNAVFFGKAFASQCCINNENKCISVPETGGCPKSYRSVTCESTYVANFCPQSPSVVPNKDTAVKPASVANENCCFSEKSKQCFLIDSGKCGADFVFMDCSAKDICPLKPSGQKAIPPMSASEVDAKNLAPANTNTTTTSPVITNPLEFDSVEGFLKNFLGVLQKVIVLLSLIFIVIGAVMYIISAGTGLMETAKKTITAAVVGLALGMAAPSFLKEISDIMGWTGETAIDPGTLSITQIATNVLSFLLGAIGILAIIMLVIGGSMYLTSAGNEDRIDTGKKIVKSSIIGVVISLSAMVLVRQLARLFM